MSDAKSACCGYVAEGDCAWPHLYCFNRTPKEASMEAMSIIEDQMRLTKEAVARESAWDVCGPQPTQAKINEATHGVVGMTTNSNERKEVPICTGVLDYFPLALAAVARLSKIGNDKHNPGMPLHWSRGKSTDHADCIIRHQLERGTVDTDGELHDVKVAWRALAQLQLAEEKRLGISPPAPPPALPKA